MPIIKMMDSYSLIIAIATLLFLAVANELFQAADDTLYESKRQGRDRVLVATSVGLDGEIAKGTDADSETPVATDNSIGTGSDAVAFPLGKLGGNLIP